MDSLYTDMHNRLLTDFWMSIYDDVPEFRSCHPMQFSVSSFLSVP